MTPKLNACIEGAPVDDKIYCIDYITEEKQLAEKKLNEELIAKVTDIAMFPLEVDVVDEDWLAGVSCNPDEPEMCESCQ